MTEQKLKCILGWTMILLCGMVAYWAFSGK
jgi:hypothetical protein